MATKQSSRIPASIERKRGYLVAVAAQLGQPRMEGCLWMRMMFVRPWVLHFINSWHGEWIRHYTT